jgi:inner membrane protein
MDLLTHTAVGIFLNRAGLGRLTPWAAPILVLAANAPDVDAVSAAAGTVEYLHFHRHLTHSLAALPAMAVLPVLLVGLAARGRIRWGGALLASLCGVASHLLLDLTNAYGVPLLLPFSAHWYRLDLVNIADLWVWAVFFLCLAAPFVARLVGSEISSGTQVKTPGRGFAWCALLFLLAYDSGRAVLHTRALAVLESRLYENIAPTRVAAMPDAVNPWKWRGLAETPDFFAVSDVDLLGDFDPTRAAVFRKPAAGPLIVAARGTRPVAEFLRYAEYPLWHLVPVSQPEGAQRVELMDVRFGDPLRPGLVASALISSSLRPLESAFTFGSFHSR